MLSFPYESFIMDVPRKTKYIKIVANGMERSNTHNVLFTVTYGNFKNLPCLPSEGFYKLFLTRGKIEL